ncbi:hypothetical protein Vadar_029791 [Vaccinium darrowii]|uniref:Uncharacterized protein n=1 Tax=Vaccinium darrowii TaxID=229202 RepID=A0ACB7ZMR9_9ERIC|nr:hypothetical protein Vadar_029791 [Vaccinium darrowii]
MVCSLPEVEVEVEVKVEREAGGAAGGGSRRSPFLCTERTKMGFEICKRRDLTATLVQSAERYGFKAIILTVDTPRLGRREAEIKNRMIAPQMKLFEGLLPPEGASDNGSKLEAYATQILDSSLSWKTNENYLYSGMLLLAAIKATEVGVAGIIVSNHGARQLDYSPATVTVLEEVVVAVGGKIPVFIDGGIRRGTDIFKALALGAKAVMLVISLLLLRIGRPVLYGLAAKGEQGVRQVMEMLKNELELTMALSGCPTLKDIPRSRVSLSMMPVNLVVTFGVEKFPFSSSSFIEDKLPDFQHSRDAKSPSSIVGSWESSGPFAVDLFAAAVIVGSVAAEVKQHLVGVSLFLAAGIIAFASAATSVFVVAAASAVVAAAAEVAGSCKDSSLSSTLLVPWASLPFATMD